MKEEGTSGYQLVTHHHTEAQPCFSLYPQLTPLSDALCSQTHRTLGKIENKVGLRERAARQAGDLRGSVSADRHACQSALWIRRPSGVRPSIPTRGSPVPSARVSQSTAPRCSLPLHRPSCHLPLAWRTKTTPRVALSHYVRAVKTKPFS